MQNKSKISSIKAAGIVVLIMMMALVMTACDMMGEEEAAEEFDEYSMEAEIELGELVQVQEDIEEIAEELVIEVTRGVQDISYDIDYDDGRLTVELEGLRGSMVLEFKHDRLANALLRAEPEKEGETVTVEMGGDLTMELSVETERLDVMNLETEIHRLDVENDGGMAWVDRVVFISGGETASTRQVEDPFYAAGSSGESVGIEMALLDGAGNVAARAETRVSADEDLSMDLELVEDDESIADFSGDSTVEPQTREDYLARYQLSEQQDMDEPEEKIVNLSEYDTAGEVSLPDDGYIVVNQIAISLDYLTPDNFAPFHDIFSEEAQKHDSFEDMELYIKTSEDASLRTADLEDTADELEVKFGLEEYIDSGGNDHKLALAEISYQRQELFPSEDEDIEDDNEVVYYTVSVINVYGVEGARSFTIGDYNNTPHAFGVEMEERVPFEQDNDNMDIYVLGESPEEYEFDGDTYEISNARQLQNALSRHYRHEDEGEDIIYKLIDTIDMEEIEDWEPIGSSAPNGNPFQGTFDGQGYRIRNLNVESDRADTGLFGYIGEEGRVENLNLREVTVSGSRYVGGLAGRNEGRIEDITLEEVDVNSPEQDVGGLVGQNMEGATISDSLVTEGTVSSELEYVGGLAGSNMGTIENSNADVEVDGLAYVGGLVGWNDANGVHYSAAYGDISGVEDNVGGLVGYNTGTIENSHYGMVDEPGNVESDGDNIGGLVGLHGQKHGQGDALIENAHASAAVSGLNSVGGLVGESWAKIDSSDYAGITRIDVTAERELAGGLVGHNQESAYINSGGVRGTVDGEDIIGRFIGRNNSENIDGTFYEEVELLNEEAYEGLGYVGHDEHNFVGDADIDDFPMLQSLTLEVDGSSAGYLSVAERTVGFEVTASYDDGSDFEVTDDEDLVIEYDETLLTVDPGEEKIEFRESGTTVDITVSYQDETVDESVEDTVTVDVEYPYGEVSFDDQAINLAADEYLVEVRVGDFGYVDDDSVWVDIVDEDGESVLEGGEVEVEEQGYTTVDLEDSIDAEEDLTVRLYENEGDDVEDLLDDAVADIAVLEVEVEDFDDGDISWNLGDSNPYAGEEIEIELTVDNVGDTAVLDQELRLIVADGNDYEIEIGEEISVPAGDTREFTLTYEPHEGVAYEAEDDNVNFSAELMGFEADGEDDFKIQKPAELTVNYVFTDKVVVEIDVKQSGILENDKVVVAVYDDDGNEAGGDSYVGDTEGENHIFELDDVLAEGETVDVKITDTGTTAEDHVIDGDEGNVVEGGAVSEFSEIDESIEKEPASATATVDGDDYTIQYDDGAEYNGYTFTLVSSDDDDSEVEINQTNGEEYDIVADDNADGSEVADELENEFGDNWTVTADGGQQGADFDGETLTLSDGVDEQPGQYEFTVQSAFVDGEELVLNFVGDYGYADETIVFDDDGTDNWAIDATTETDISAQVSEIVSILNDHSEIGNNVHEVTDNDPTITIDEDSDADGDDLDIEFTVQLTD